MPSSEPATVSILVVDGHDLVHCALRSLLECDGSHVRVLSAYDAPGAARLAGARRPEAALVGLEDQAAAIRLCRRMRAASQDTRILLMSTVEPDARRTGAAGVCGWVPRCAPAVEIATAVRLLALRAITGDLETHAEARLSMREQEVLQLLRHGATDREIAAELCLSIHTVKGHTRSLYRKLGARNRTDAAIRAAITGAATTPTR